MVPAALPQPMSTSWAPSPFTSPKVTRSTWVAALTKEAAVRQRSWYFSKKETRTPPPSVETKPTASETPSPVQSFMMMAERFSPRLG